MDYSYSLTFQEYWRLRRDSMVLRAVRKSEKAGAFDDTCFPFSSKYKWNRDHYGKIYVPRINDTIRLDTVSFKLYAVIIKDYEMNKTELRHDSIFINDQLSDRYVIKKNYYFVLGDNRDNAIDSRNWGFLPENMIVGKVIRTIKSNRP
jgi:signal peptidase I